jgi:agmatine/peptidylarginine deiminase
VALSSSAVSVSQTSRSRTRRVSKAVLLLLLCGLLFGAASFVGGLLIGKHQAEVGLRDKPIEADRHKTEEEVIPAPAERVEGRIPGEFEHQAAIMIGCNEMLAYHPRTLIQMVSALRTKVKVIGLIWNEQQRTQAVDLLKANGLPEDCIDFYPWPSRSMWVRDYGPFFLMQGKDGPAIVVDYAYTQPNRDYGELFGTSFAGTFGYKFTRAELSFEGGNLLTNGDGLVVSSNSLVAQNASRGYNLEQLGDVLGHSFRFQQWARLMPLEREPTHHVDMFCTFCATSLAVVGSCTQQQDATNADILDKNADTLASESTSQGPMKVARIPMPYHRDGNWRTYTNVIFANGTLLVPQYFGDDVELDKVALATYRKLLPNWEVVGIDCSTLADKRGALHCISFNIPWLPKAK